MKKKKNKRGYLSRIRILLLGFILLALAILAILQALIITPAENNTFATEPWYDPLMVCSTEWRPIGREVNPPELLEVLADTQLPIIEISVMGAEANCNNPYGTATFYEVDNIRILIDDMENWSSDHAQIGNIARRVLAAISDTEASQAWNDDDMLYINFIVDGNWRASWRMNYRQAVRAYEAGLTGLDLYQLGIGR